MKKDNFKSPDFYNIDTLFNEEQLLIRDTVREWVKENISPIIEDCALSGNFPKDIVKKLAEIGGFGGFLPTNYGGSEIDFTSYGLMMQELERGDSSIRVLSSVQSLVMNTIYSLGSDDQKQKYLPKLASGELIGSFGMSEPNHGSDPSSMKSHYSEEKDYYIVNGSKMWIGHAPICDIAVIWAKSKSNSMLDSLLKEVLKVLVRLKLKKNGHLELLRPVN